MQNLFTIGNMIQNPAEFVGRTGELNHIITRLGKLESCSVVGEHLQAVASELVNHLNDQQKTRATRADLDAAVEKVLTSANAYFVNTWREDNSATEQTVLRAYAEGAGESVTEAEFQYALQSLIHKEMMERDGYGYRLAVPLFGLWILRNQSD